MQKSSCNHPQLSLSNGKIAAILRNTILQRFHHGTSSTRPQTNMLQNIIKVNVSSTWVVYKVETQMVNPVYFAAHQWKHPHDQLLPFRPTIPNNQGWCVSTWVVYKVETQTANPVYFAEHQWKHPHDQLLPVWPTIPNLLLAEITRLRSFNSRGVWSQQWQYKNDKIWSNVFPEIASKKWQQNLSF